MKIFGILNITDDSFSDAGEFLEQEASIKKANSLFEEGASVIDIGAQSSNVNAKQISVELEWQRINPVIKYLKSKNIPISIDSFKPEIILKSIESGVDYLNNINSFKTDESKNILKENINRLPELIIMFSHNQSDKAEAKSSLRPSTIIDIINKFFDNKINELVTLGVPTEKIIIDPGMGLFLGEDPELSLEVIRNAKKLKQRFGRIMVSVSRKSFIGNLLGGIPPIKRKAGTLASELFLYSEGVDFIRTHEPGQLREAIIIQERITNVNRY